MTKFGYCAFAGRPNAGKSTLLNRLVGEKVAIVSPRAQTTRHRILCILTNDRGQVVFLDTPGLHRPLHRLNRVMMQEARSAWEDADLICLVRDASISFGKGEEYLIQLLSQHETPKLVVLNKVDRVNPKSLLLPEIERYAKALHPVAVVPVSALTGENCDRLLEEIFAGLPPGAPRFPRDILTVHSERFLAAEEIREKILLHTHAELPFVSAVRIEQWKEGQAKVWIDAEILVERESQRAILLGKGGRTIRQVGTEARLALEQMLGKAVVLHLHVRVEKNWREREDLVREFESEPPVVLLESKFKESNREQRRY